MKKPLSIAIVVNKKGTLPVWEYEMIQNLSKQNYIAEIVFIKANENPVVFKSSFAYRLFTKFECWWFSSTEDALKDKRVSDKVIEESEAGNIRADIIYISSTVSLNYQAPISPHFGTWRIILGKGKYKNAKPPAFWEVMNNDPVTGSSLVVKNNNEEVTVYDGASITIPFSVKNNLIHLVWKSSSFLQYRLKELYESGPDLFFNKYSNKKDNTLSSPYRQLLSPGNFKMIWLFKRNVFRYLFSKIRQKIRNDSFTIMVSGKSYGSSLPAISTFKALPLVKEKFMADPFVVNQNGVDFIFFEEYIYEKNKAHISVIELNKGRTVTEPRIVLDKPYHLSYPFVFEWQGEWYMIPETAANKTVELYRCNQFPHQWEFVKCLFENVSLIDCTLLYHENKWWLFAVTQSHPFTTANDQLLLFYSEDLFSTNWKAHPQNPVVTDISNCRPAGRIFSKEGKLYRPAQNNASQQYGYGLKLNRIDIMNEYEYRETVGEEYNPGAIKGLLAVHTFNFTDNVSVIDGILKTQNS